MAIKNLKLTHKTKLRAGRTFLFYVLALFSLYHALSFRSASRFCHCVSATG